MGIVAIMTVGTFMHPLNPLQRADFHWNNQLALYSMVVFATSANQAVIHRGIRMTYGMSIDYLGYSGIAKQYVQRGATLITREPGGEVAISMVPLTAVVSTKVRGK